MQQHTYLHTLTAHFLSALQAEGYTLGIDKHLTIQTLLQKLPEDTDAETLKISLVALIAQNPQEQEAFYTLFEGIEKENVPYATAISSKEEDKEPIKQPRISKLTAIIVGIIMVLLICFGIYWFYSPKEEIIDTPKTNDTIIETSKPAIQLGDINDSLFIPNKALPFPNHIKDYAHKEKTFSELVTNQLVNIFLLTIGFLYVLFVIYYQAKRNHQFVIRKSPNDKPPYLWNIKIQGINDVLWNTALQQMAQLLHLRSETDTFHLDIHKTIEASITKGGLPIFVYKTQTQAPEYVLLIDRQSAHNHRALLFNELYELLKAQDIVIDRFYFDSDIRICYNEKYPQGIAFAEIQQQFWHARLLIVGSGSQLLSPLTGKPASWTAAFLQWKERVLFTPTPTRTWGYGEQQLASLFTVLPATIQSLGFWVNEIQAGEEAHWEDWREKITDAPAMPIRLEDEENLLSILQLYFDEEMIQWIAACAIYPDIHWDLTLWLGQQLSTPENELVSLENLMQLCRLTWFVNGNMPDTVRKILIDWFEQKDNAELNRLRLALVTELQKNPPPQDSVAWDSFQMSLACNEWLATQDEQRKKAIEKEIADLLAKGIELDFTFIQRIENAPTKGDFVIPEAWRKFLQHTELSVKEWFAKRWTWISAAWLITVALFVFVSFLFSLQKNVDCPGTNINVDSLSFCMGNDREALAYHEYLVQKALEKGNFAKVDSLMMPDIRLKPAERIMKPAKDKFGKPIQGGYSIVLPATLTDKDSIYQNLPYNIHQILGRFDLKDTITYQYLKDRDRNFATLYYRLARESHLRGQADSACTLIRIAYSLDSINYDFILLKKLICNEMDDDDIYFALYPNPVINSKINIRLNVPLLKNNRNYFVILYNMQEQIVFEEQIAQDGDYQRTLDFTELGLEKGKYVVSLIVGPKRYSRTILVI